MMKSPLKISLLATLAFVALWNSSGVTHADLALNGKPWVAFIGEYGGYTPQSYQVLGATPRALVATDGTVLWYDWSRRSDKGGTNPEMWRMGSADPAAFADFKKSMVDASFFTATPVPVSDSTGIRMVISDASTTRVGLNLAGRTRVISTYALGMSGNDDYIKSIVAVRDAIRKLIPAKSTVYMPNSIRVGIWTYGGSTDTAIPWPLSSPPTATGDKYLILSGVDAKLVVDTLAKSNIIQGGFIAEWAPDLSIPPDIQTLK